MKKNNKNEEMEKNNKKNNDLQKQELNNENNKNQESNQNQQQEQKQEPQEQQENQQKQKEPTIEEQFAELQQKYNDLNDKYLRLTADFDNYRKRTLKEKMDLVKSGGSDILAGFLSTIDDMERGLKYINETDDINALREGINIIYNSLKEFLKQKGVSEIEAMNQVFDTNYHEAISTIPAPTEDLKGKVVDVIQKGYLYNEKVLRIAKVVVAQ